MLLLLLCCFSTHDNLLLCNELPNAKATDTCHNQASFAAKYPAVWPPITKNRSTALLRQSLPPQKKQWRLHTKPDKARMNEIARG